MQPTIITLLAAFFLLQGCHQPKAVLENVHSKTSSENTTREEPDTKNEIAEKYKFEMSEECGMCHEDHMDQWKYSLHAQAHFEPVYDAYFIKASQETNGLTQRELHEGEASITGEGPKRKHVSKHYFVGPNIMFANHEDAKPLKSLSLKLI